MMKTRILYLLIVPVLFFAGCKKSSEPAPTVQTINPPFKASTRVTLGVRISSPVKQSFLVGGVYVGESSNPEINLGSKFNFASDTGLYYAVVSRFTANKQYYVKGYAANAGGEVLGSEITFTTNPTVLDNDNNEVETVTIGTQTWMANNLKSVHYRNGDVIGTTSPVTLDITAENSPVYQWFANGSYDTSKVYGNLYTWYAVTDGRFICPTGWHLPTDDEWTTMEGFLGGILFSGSVLKETGNKHWIAPYNTDANNMTCFTALPAGYRPASGSFALLHNEAHFWSATESETSKAWERMLSATSFSTARQGADKRAGLSVRCIKD